MSNKRFTYELVSIFAGYWRRVLHAALQRLMTIGSAVFQTVSRSCFPLLIGQYRIAFYHSWGRLKQYQSTMMGVSVHPLIYNSSGLPIHLSLCTQCDSRSQLAALLAFRPDPKSSWTSINSLELVRDHWQGFSLAIVFTIHPVTATGVVRLR
jgi:hypothetical protein